MGNARFSPLSSGGNIVPTLYLAETIGAALMETALRDVPSPSTDFVVSLDDLRSRNLRISEVELVSPALVDLTSLGLRRLGVKASELTDTEVESYEVTRQWAEWLHDHATWAHGLLWMSRQLSSHRVCVLFGDRPAVVRPTGAQFHLDQDPVQQELEDLVERLGAALL